MTHLDPMDDSTELAPHTRLWRDVCLRSSGFPFAYVEVLEGTDVARAADEVLEAYRDRAATVAQEDLREVEASLERYWRVVPERLAAHPLSERMGAAVARQNLSAYLTTVGRLLFEGRYRSGNSKDRGKLNITASYLQRYAARNDSIGFYGPVAWGRIGTAERVISWSPAEELVTNSISLLETWAVRTLGASLLDTPALRPELAPLLAPQQRVVEEGLRGPFGRVVPLGDRRHVIAQLCDGKRSAREIAAELADLTLDEVLAIIEAMGRDRQLSWEFIPDASLCPERALASFVASLPPSEDRQYALSALEEIEDCARALSDASAPPDDVAAASRRLNDRFEEVTGASSSRRPGETYAGRSVSFLECRRGVDFELGRQFVDRLAAPLSLVAQSVRWLLGAIEDRYRSHLDAVYRDLVGAEGGGVDLTDLWLGCADIWFDGSAVFLEPIITGLQDRWEQVFAAHAGSRQRRASSREVASLVDEKFQVDGRSSLIGQYACPDLLIAAPDGDPHHPDTKIVLGEMHLSLNTLGTLALSQHHPDIEALRAQWTADRRGRGHIALSVQGDMASSRLRTAFDRPEDVKVRLGPGSPMDANTVPLSDFEVERRDGRLIARSRSRGQVSDLLCVLEDAISSSAMNAFRPFRTVRHRPRILLDSVVVSRETWSFTVEHELAELRSRRASRRFLGARRLARDHGLPRFVFCTYDSGSKPLFVDLASPASVEVWARHLRGARGDAVCSVSEMLPGPDELWLTDAQGRRYTAELRCAVALDPINERGGSHRQASDRARPTAPGRAPSGTQE